MRVGVATIGSAAPIVSQIIFDGQSFNLAPTGGFAYPDQLMALLPGASYQETINAGVSGTTYAQRTTDATTRVDAHISTTVPTLLLDAAGVSDLYPVASGGSAMSAASVLSAAKTYHANRRAAGVDKIFMLTVTPATVFNGDAPSEAQRIAYNNLVRSDPSFTDVIDIASLPHASDPTNTTYFSDGLHPTPTLAGEFAALARASLARSGYPT